MADDGGLVNDGTRRKAALALSAAMFLILGSLPFWDDKGRQVALAAYGPRPLGVPWPAFHLLALLLSLPMPAFWSNHLLVWDRARARGVVLIGPLS